ncbi:MULTISPECIES: hypothetical protein [Rhizobium/Agrobacterium group]|nr:MULTISPECIES: hypothetical protein [Rhizobium/Agrobacterium group]
MAKTGRGSGAGDVCLRLCGCAERGVVPTKKSREVQIEHDRALYAQRHRRELLLQAEGLLLRRYPLKC